MALPLSSTSFAKIPVTSRSPIKNILKTKKLEFKKGKAFYEMTKSEIIQDYKTLVVMRKADGAMITGEKVRDVLNIPKVTTITKVSLDLEEIPDFKVFVQSTSHNRVLLPDTTLLYLTGDLASPTEDPEPEEETTPTARARVTRVKKVAAVVAKKPAKRGTKPAKAIAPATTTRATRGIKNAKATTAAKATKVVKTAKVGRAVKTAKKVKTTKATKPAAVARPVRVAKRKAIVDLDDDDEDDEPAAVPVAKKKRGAVDEKKDAEPVPAPVPRVDDSGAKAKPTGSVGENVEVAFSFDTTGSMYPCLGEVRRKLQEVITRLKRDVPGIRMAIIAHGDYCDRNSSYVTKHLDFTDNQTSLCNFVQNVGPTGGGDWPECYELVLREAYTKLNWGANTQRSLVMIGDATPHEPNYSLNTQNIDWRKECEELKKRNIRIYSVQALNNSSSDFFYRGIAERTGGYHLHLDQFSSIANFMLAICYRERGDESLQQFQDEMQSRGMNRELHRLFDNLSGRTTTFTATSSEVDTSSMTPVNPSRFQVLEVDRKISIKEFVLENSLVFKTGRGFYEFTKPEAISNKKEVVIVHISTGDMFTGPEACELVGAGSAGKISPATLSEFRVFVQSTSYNRVLVAGTGFLYEVDPSA